MGQRLCAWLSGCHRVASQSVCASVWLLGLVCGATEAGGTYNMKQPSLSYNCVVSLDAGWNVGLGGIHPIHVHNEQHESPASVIKWQVIFWRFGFDWNPKFLNVLSQLFLLHIFIVILVFLSYLFKNFPSGIPSVFLRLILFFLPFPQWVSFTNLSWPTPLCCPGRADKSDTQVK